MKDFFVNLWIFVLAGLMIFFSIAGSLFLYMGIMLAAFSPFILIVYILAQAIGG